MKFKVTCAVMYFLHQNTLIVLTAPHVLSVLIEVIKYSPTVDTDCPISHHYWVTCC